MALRASTPRTPRSSLLQTPKGFDNGLSRLREDLLYALTPQPRLSITDIAEKHRLMPSDTAAPGAYQNILTPYTREIQDRLHPDDPAQIIVYEAAAQAGGKSTTGENWIMAVAGGYYPSRMLVVLDTDLNAKDWSKDNLDTMIDLSPLLRDRIRDSVSRAKNETILGKWYPGGRLRVVGGHSASAVCRMAAKYCWLDEVDRFKENPGYEGNVVALVLARQTTFGPSRKMLLTSTPTVEGDSEIHEWYLRGDQRLFHVPCVHCGEMQPLDFQDPVTHEYRLVWDKGDPSSVRYICKYCGHSMVESDKNVFLPSGIWVPSRPDLGGGLITSYNLNGLYSPVGWVSWSDLAAEWDVAVQLSKAGDHEKLQTFVNTRLAKTFRTPGEQLDKNVLEDRIEPDWGDIIPAGIKVITTGTDVQKDRVEVTTVGWGLGWECWVLSHDVILTSPRDDETWARHDNVIRRVWTTADGRRLHAAASCVDSGFLTQKVYEYCKPRARWGVFAIKGDPGKGAIWEKVPHRGGKNKTLGTFYVVRVNPAKDELHDHLLVKTPGPKYVHINRAIPDAISDYLEQLVNERRVKDKTGRWVWEKVTSSKAVEAWDCLVYNLAAAHSLVLGGVNLKSTTTFTTATPPPIVSVPNATTTPEFSEPSTTQPPARDQGKRTNPARSDPARRGKPTSSSSWLGGRGPRRGSWL